MGGSDGDGMNEEYVVVIIILCVVVVLLVIGIGYFIYKNRKQKMQLQESNPSGGVPPIRVKVTTDDAGLLQTTEPKGHISPHHDDDDD
eukprot:UN09645